MSTLEQTRQDILRQTDEVGVKRRFGLFSHAPSTAVGDNSPAFTKLHPRDQTGKPATQPRQIQASHIQSGNTRKSYFNPINSLACHSSQHDQYLQESVRLLKEENKAFQKRRKQTNFVPECRANPKLPTNSAYKYKEEMRPELDPKRYKMEDGKVRTGFRNFYTNSDRKVIDTFFKNPEYIIDPYQREHDQEMERYNKQKAKQLQEKFKPNNFAPRAFQKDQKVYKSAVFQKKQKLSKSTILNHEVNWKSNSFEKQGINGMFQPVHPYMENPPPQRKPRSLIKDREGFKGMGALILSTPSPSISLNKVNVMRSINRSLSPKH